MEGPAQAEYGCQCSMQRQLVVQDPRLVRKEWEALLEEVTRETARMGLHDCSYRLLRVDAMEDEVLADQLDILAGVHRGSSTW